MSPELLGLSQQVALGRGSRRDFLGRAAALGVSASVANMLLVNAAQAAGPVKGGIIKVGLVVLLIASIFKGVVIEPHGYEENSPLFTLDNNSAITLFLISLIPV